ncbi:MAG: hypothetical protein AUF76_05025 [Acidobacteria bacterium 13_1_20CM_2_65_9]|nr:MAG: hypothetical protein AUF76_05025 [Acidobacteria bacterium 13_1_20CM_2_65_9]
MGSVGPVTTVARVRRPAVTSCNQLGNIDDRGTHMNFRTAFALMPRGSRKTATQAPATPQPFAVPAEYLSLHKYLDDRYANTVVLTFAEIEDLLGFTLPDLARLQQEWWANADAGSSPSAQSRSWTQASRSAKPNLLAQTVVFERASA